MIQLPDSRLQLIERNMHDRRFNTSLQALRFAARDVVLHIGGVDRFITAQTYLKMVRHVDEPTLFVHGPKAGARRKRVA